MFLLFWWARSSAVERFSDKEEVEGPTPSAPTKIIKENSLKSCFLLTRSLFFAIVYSCHVKGKFF